MRLNKRGKIFRAYRSFRAAVMGPQILAFLPALMLGAFWYGGEGFLLYLALLVPALFALSGVISDSGIGLDGRDGSTGLALRKTAVQTLYDYLERENETGMATAAFVIAMDGLDEIERQHGYRAVAELRSKTADRIRGALRDSDLAFRLEDNKFGFIASPMRRSDLEILIQMSARVQAAMNDPFSIDAVRMHMTVCVGFCSSGRTPSKDGNVMLECAEEAVASAQLNGPGSIRAFSPETKRRNKKRTDLDGTIADAIETDQIFTWFQPQVSTDTGQISGFEAVARWSHPTQGVISQAEFQPSLATVGLTERLNEIILSQALAAIRDWDKAELEIPKVSVNFSTAELANPNLLDKTKWELDRFGVAAKRLSIEIHEELIANMKDETVTRNIAGLSALGCGIELDDFGTGHASIASIRRFSVDRIKIDRSFVARVDRDREQQNMVAAVLTMADRLELETVAEGVETIGEHAMLAQLGCAHVQGHSVAGPMQFEETAKWITQHRAKQALPSEIMRKSG